MTSSINFADPKQKTPLRYLRTSPFSVSKQHPSNTMNKSKKFAGNSRMRRTELNKIYGNKKARPDAECFEKDAFAVNTIMGSGFDFRGRLPAFELNEFNKFYDFKITPKVWNRLLDQHN